MTWFFPLLLPVPFLYCSLQTKPFLCHSILILSPFLISLYRHTHTSHTNLSFLPLRLFPPFPPFCPPIVTFTGCAIHLSHQANCAETQWDGGIGGGGDGKRNNQRGNVQYLKLFKPGGRQWEGYSVAAAASVG